MANVFHQIVKTVKIVKELRITTLRDSVRDMYFIIFFYSLDYAVAQFFGWPDNSGNTDQMDISIKRSQDSTSLSYQMYKGNGALIAFGSAVILDGTPDVQGNQYIQIFVDSNGIYIESVEMLIDNFATGYSVLINGGTLLCADDKMFLHLASSWYRFHCKFNTRVTDLWVTYAGTVRVGGVRIRKFT